MLSELLRQRAAVAPHRPFIVGRHSWTNVAAVGEMEALRLQLAGVTSRAAILFSAASSDRWLYAFLAILDAGHIPVPAVTEHEASSLAAHRSSWGALFRWDCDLGRLEAIQRETLAPHLPARAVFGLTTSGSTGTPKIVVRTVESLVAEGHRYAEWFGLDDTDKILCPQPLYHAYSMGLAVGTAFSTGGAICSVDGYSPGAMVEAVDNRQATVIGFVPTTARLFCANPRHMFGSASVKHVLIGAGPVNAELDRLVERGFSVHPSRNYGCSEMGCLFASRAESVPDGCIGTPLKGVTIGLVGGSEQGRLRVRTDTPFLGYLRPNALESGIVRDGGWYDTGDIVARRADGLFLHVSRVSRVIRNGSKSIDPVEVQNALNEHPAVADSCVVGIERRADAEIVAAHVELRRRDVDQRDLHRFLSAKISAYKVPIVWRFYDRLPRLSNGKIDTAALAQG